MDKKEIQVIALSASESSPKKFVLVLEELVSKKRIAMIIGDFEAQAIAIHMERMQLPRPLTHDVFKTTIEELGATLSEVIIHNIIDHIFYAWLVIKTNEKIEKKIDIRASDAIALAIRFDCPIYIYDSVFEDAALETAPKNFSMLKGSLAGHSIEELEALLKDVLAKEDYESATRIRDIINKRK